jgi:RNA polymerase sigma-70 factor, ECF subfamily
MNMQNAVTLNDNTDLLSAARDGSLEALGDLYRTHSRVVHAVAYRLLASHADAEDVLQDVFVGLPRALRSYSEQGRFEAWLKRLAVRTALTRLRGQQRRREEPLDALAPHAHGRDTHPVERLAARRAIAALPAPLRTVFVLREVDGYTHAEIAEMLGITEANSATRLSRAWSALRREAR